MNQKVENQLCWILMMTCLREPRDVHATRHILSLDIPIRSKCDIHGTMAQPFCHVLDAGYILHDPLKYALLRCGSSLASGCKPQICGSHGCGYVGRGCWPFCKQGTLQVKYALNTGAQEDVVHHRWSDGLGVSFLRRWK